MIFVHLITFWFQTPKMECQVNKLLIFNTFYFLHIFKELTRPKQLERLVMCMEMARCLKVPADISFRALKKEILSWRMESDLVDQSSLIWSD